jgi:hypothetical protein
MRFTEHKHAGFTRAFLIRMLFSCLVDADFLETERGLSLIDSHLASSAAEHVAARTAGNQSKLARAARELHVDQHVSHRREPHAQLVARHSGARITPPPRSRSGRVARGCPLDIYDNPTQSAAAIGVNLTQRTKLFADRASTGPC